MPELNRLIILQENKEPISLIVKLGQENDFLFSPSFLNGHVDKAIDELINTSIVSEGDYFPINHGINIIDFKENKIINMNRRSWPSKIPFIVLKSSLIFSSNIGEAFQNNLVKIINKKEDEVYDVKKFFGTTDIYKIKLLLDDKYADYRLEANGVIKDYANKFLCLSVPKFLAKPHNSHFVSEFIDPNDYEKAFFKLNSKIDLDNKNIQAWFDYTKDYSNDIVHDAFKQKVQVYQEKNQLEKMLTQTQLKKGLKI